MMTGCRQRELKPILFALLLRERPYADICDIVTSRARCRTDGVAVGQCLIYRIHSSDWSLQSTETSRISSSCTACSRKNLIWSFFAGVKRTLSLSNTAARFLMNLNSCPVCKKISMRLSHKLFETMLRCSCSKHSVSTENDWSERIFSSRKPFILTIPGAAWYLLLSEFVPTFWQVFGRSSFLK